jgi:hypothetical protein
MNKKVNTALFILGATVFNLIVMALLILLGLFLISLLPLQQASAGLSTVLMILVFFGSIVVSFLLYHKLVKYLSTKIDMDKYFHPIFRKKK